MEHLKYAKRSLDQKLQEFIEVRKEGVAPTVKFTVQSAPVSEVGINGIQASDIIEFCWHLIFSLDHSHPCMENKATLSLLSQAHDMQVARTNNRIDRGVEGTNQD